MAVIIPQALLNATSEVSINFDVTKLTPIQMNNVRKNVLNGHSPYNTSATSHLAMHILKHFKLPHFRSNGWRLYWRNLMPDHELYDRAIGLLSIAKLDPEHARSAWKGREIDECLQAMNERKPSSYLAYYHMLEDKEFKAFKKTMKVDHSENKELVDFMDRIKSGEIQSIKMTLWKNNE